MADIRASVRNLFFHSVKAVNSAASSIATSTKMKVDEMNLRNRRREAMNDVSKRVHSLWQSGVELPEELMNLMEEIADIDEALIDLKEQAAKKAEETAAQSAAPEAEEAVEYVEADEVVEADAADEPDVPVLEVAEDAPYAEAAQELAEEIAEEESNPVEDAIASIRKTFSGERDA